MLPRLTCWFVRASFVYLLLGFSMGGFILAAKGGADARPWLWLPAHVDALLVGWMIQFALGVAYWIFPRAGGQRGPEGPIKASFALLNVGLAISVWLTLLSVWLTEQTWLRSAFPLGLLLQMLALAVFASQMWRRTLTLPELASRRQSGA